jgi:hypothetical protein
MAKRRRRNTSQGRIGIGTQLLIAGLVAAFLLGGGASILNNYTGFAPLDGSQNGDMTGLIFGIIAIAIGLGILLWRRIVGVSRSRWSAMILGIRSVEDIYAMTPAQFEQFVGFLFQQQGYETHVVGQTGDEGIDIELVRRGQHGPARVVAQCKRYRGSVGQPIVREFFGSFADHAAEGYLVTTGTFTQPARDWAASRPLRLIDGPQLLAWTEDVAHRLAHSHEHVAAPGAGIGSAQS